LLYYLQVDEPVALIEWDTTRGDAGARHTAKFEMKAEEVSKMISALDSISKAFVDVMKDESA
jgi:hypothetical protein